jgi:paraquat-inducible protein B
MSVQRNATMVGAFVLGAVAIAVGIAVVFGSGLFFRDVVRFVIFFDGSLEGLQLGAPVKFRGVQVGEVVSISPIYQAARRSLDIPVVVELNHDSIESASGNGNQMQAMIDNGLRAQLALESLITGQLYVSLDFFPHTPIATIANTTGYPEIPSIPSLQDDFQETLNKLVIDAPRLQTGLLEMLDLMNAMAQNNSAQEIAGGLRSVARLADTLAKPDGPLLLAIDRIPPLLANLERATAELPAIVGQVDRTLVAVHGLVEGPEAPVARSLRELDGTLANARRLTDQLATVVGQVRAPVVGFAQSGLPDLQGLIKDLDRTTSEISRTVRDLRQDPERFLLGDPAAEGVRLQ